MTDIWLVIPAYGRHELTDITLHQKRIMADELQAEGIHVNAVIVADDENLDIARTHNFDTIEHTNQLGARYNAGIHHAYQQGADYICPDGSDDWIHPDYLTNLPTDGTVRTARACWVTDETGHRIAHLSIRYDGGAGCRVYPRQIFEAARTTRPADNRRARGLDTSILTNLEAALGHPLRWQPTDDPDLIAEFKTGGGHQLNSYRDCLLGFGIKEYTEPYLRLGELYPAACVNRIMRHYGHPVSTPTARRKQVA